MAAAIGLDPEATILPVDQPHGADMVRHPLRRIAEIGAHLRRIGPWADAIAAAAPDTDVFHTQSITALPAVQAAAHRLGARYVYDYADIQTDGARLARLPGPIRSLARGFETRWARGASARLAASSGLASVVERRTHIRPAVVMNCPPAWQPGIDEPPRFDRIREHLGIPTDRPIVLHHGQLKLGRGIEELVAAAATSALAGHDPAVVIMGFGRLESYARAAAARLPDRVYVLPPVPPDELLEWIASADVAYLGIPPATPNIRLTLPNKLFESMMAGVPSIAATGTAAARLIEREGVGRLARIEFPDELATALNALLDMPPGERSALRRHCRTVALRSYSWEIRQGPLIDAYRSLTAGDCSRTSIADRRFWPS